MSNKNTSVTVTILKRKLSKYDSSEKFLLIEGKVSSSGPSHCYTVSLIHIDDILITESETQIL